jgi:hypothetical protein
MDKPIWKEWWFWLSIVVLVVVATPKLRVWAVALVAPLASWLLREGTSTGGSAMKQRQIWS